MHMELSTSHGEPLIAEQPLVLVVDDNEDNLTLLAFLVEQLNCTLLTAINGKTALDLAQRFQPRLILLDMMLPDMDGMEVVSCIRENPLTKGIPVIAVTALARPEDREHMLAAGCNEYVSKPFFVEEMEALLYRYLPITD